MTSVAEAEPRTTSHPSEFVLLPGRERLLALDVFRGATIAGMLLVNNPGSWSAVYPPLRHAEWHGWTATDLIFPFFLFIVGVTTHLSLNARRARGESDAALVRQILRRGILIILLGLFLNAFPFYSWGAIREIPDPTLWQRVIHRFENLRLLGVLQRIGICYIAAGLLTLRTTVKHQVAMIAALLVGYWLAMTLLPVPGTGQLGFSLLDQPDKTLAAWLDRAMLGTEHLWRQSKTWDPEGPLSTFPAIATTMLGVLAGRAIQGGRPLMERIAGLFAWGSLGMMAGLMWHWLFPINKNLWTSSYVVFTAGMAAVAIATCLWVIDARGVRWWTKPFEIFGMNSILAFVGSGLMARLISSLLTVPFDNGRVPLQAAIYRSVFAPYFAPKNASLLFAISFVLLWLGILWIFYRRRWYLKV
jgi:predicted acyltransferase